MSVLTKLFVVLLVVCSLLLSASVVVFVNRADEYSQTVKKNQADLTALRRENGNLNTRMGDLQNTMAQSSQAATAREGELARKLTDADKQIQDLNAQVAQAQKDAQVAAATNKGTTDALKAAQDENKGLQTALADIRTKNDDLLRQNGELNTRVTELDSKNRALDQQMRIMQEQMAEATNAGKNGSGTNGGAQGAPASAGPINAVVRSVDIIGGKKYATISVGSSDNVQKGMKFNVVNRNTGEFLGMLTVERVEPNEAIGQVEGVKIDKIQPGVDARTQL